MRGRLAFPMAIAAVLIVSIPQMGCQGGGSANVATVKLADPIGVDGKKVQVRGSLESAPDGAVAVNGVDATVEGSNFEASVPVVNGENVLLVTVGGQERLNLVLDVDMQPPEIVITNPTDKHKTSDEQVLISGVVTDENLRMVSVNGKHVEPDAESGQWTVTVPLKEMGRNDINAEAWDAVGNVSIFHIRVYRQEEGAAPQYH